MKIETIVSEGERRAAWHFRGAQSKGNRQEKKEVTEVQCGRSFHARRQRLFFLQTKRVLCSINVILTSGYAVWTRVCSFLGGVLRFFIDHSARQGNHSARLILNFLPSRKRRPWVDHSLRLGKLGQFRLGNPLLNC